MHKHHFIPSMYYQCVKGRFNGRTIRITVNPSPFEQAEAHLVETMFYDECALSRERSVSKPSGTFMPRWEDVKNNLKPDLREFLEQKRKRKEVPTVELNSFLRYVKVKTFNDQILYKL